MLAVIRFIQVTFAMGALGLVFGVANFILHAPARVPSQPLAHEWYIFAVFPCGLGAAAAFSILGALLALLVRNSSRPIIDAVIVTMGALMGMTIGWLSLHLRAAAWNAYYGTIATCGGAAVAILVVVISELSAYRKHAHET